MRCRFALLAAAALMMTACPAPDPVLDGDSKDEGSINWIALELTLESTTTTAGVAVGYTAEIVSDEGERREVEVELGSDLEPGLLLSATTLTPTVAGTHGLGASYVKSGRSFDATASLEVTAADLADLDLQLAQESAAAGEPITYEVFGWDEFRNPLNEVEAIFSAEPEVDIQPGDISATVPGAYTLVATVGAFTDQEDFTIVAGEVAELDLILASSSLEAGGSVLYTVEFYDDYGNIVSGVEATMSADPELTVDEFSISGTTAGTFQVTAEIEDAFNIWDSETVTIDPGPATSLELVVAPLDLEVGDSALAEVTMVDAYGNQADDSWGLTIEATAPSVPADVAIDGPLLTFMDDGQFWVTAETTTGLADTVGPIDIDSFGPELTLEDPPRGESTTATSGTVSGTAVDPWSGVDSVLVNGSTVSVGGDGSFSHSLPYDFGLNVIETVAVDGDGNISDDLRAVLSGQFLPYGAGVQNGIRARINQGGFDTLEVLGEGLVADTDLASLIPSPVVDLEEESCINIPFIGRTCFTWYALRLFVTDPRFASVDLDFDPRGSGVLRTTFAVNDVAVDWNGDGTAAEIDFSASGVVTANSITVQMDLAPSVVGDEINIGVSNVSVDTAGLSVDVSGLIGDALDFFGLDLGDLVEGYLEDALRDAIEESVPPLVEDLVQDLEIATDIDLFGGTYTLAALPASVSVDSNGLSLGLQTFFTPDVWMVPYDSPGSLAGGYLLPSYGGSPGMIASLGLDFLNQALFAFWGGGLLEQEFSGAELGLDLGDFPFIPAGGGDLTVTVSALLPPVITPGTGDSLLDLGVGDLEVTLWSGAPVPGNEALRMYLNLGAGLDLDATDESILADIGDIETSFDVVLPELTAAAEGGLETLLASLVPALVPLLTDALGEIPIPDIEGFSLSGIEIAPGGPDQGYVNVGGELTF